MPQPRNSVIGRAKYGLNGAWVVGASYWPDPDIAVKADYSVVRNRSTVLAAPNSFNLGLGWWF